MLSQPRRLPKRHWLFSVCAAIAIAAQLVVAISPLTEGRDPRMAAHVESHGPPTHFLHNDATCAACQARSIHGTTPPSAVAIAMPALAPSTIVRAAERDGSSNASTQQNPRAPPVVI